MLMDRARLATNPTSGGTCRTRAGTSVGRLYRRAWGAHCRGIRRDGRRNSPWAWRCTDARSGGDGTRRSRWWRDDRSRACACCGAAPVRWCRAMPLRYGTPRRSRWCAPGVGRHGSPRTPLRVCRRRCGSDCSRSADVRRAAEIQCDRDRSRSYRLGFRPPSRLPCGTRCSPFDQ